MSKMQSRLLTVAVLLAAGFAGWFSAGGRILPVSDGATTAGVISGEQVLAMNFKDASGEAQSLGQWRGKVLVVNFWATWCAPCRKEIPEFVEVSQHFGTERVGFVGLGIDSAANIARFAGEHAVSYPLLVAGTGSLPIMEGLGNPSLGLPFTLILDADGKIRVRKLGPMSGEELGEAIEGLLRG